MAKKGDIAWTPQQCEVYEALREGQTLEEIVDQGIAGIMSVKKIQKALEEGQAPPSGASLGETPREMPQETAPKAARTPSSIVTKRYKEASLITIAPKSFTMSSVVLWMAMDAVKREWNWPEEMTPEEFLNHYLVLSLKEFGILLGGYVVLPSDDGSETGEESGEEKEGEELETNSEEVLA